MDGCASACDRANQDCVGFSYYGIGKTSLCFMFSSFRTATYYTGCGKDNDKSLLQRLVRRSPGVNIDKWDCGKVGSPLQAINKDRKSYIWSLDIPSGKYEKIFEVKKDWTKPKFNVINACSINPIDSILYCAMRINRARASFVVRVDTKKVAFVARVPWAWASEFDSAGTFYYGNKKRTLCYTKNCKFGGKKRLFRGARLEKEQSGCGGFHGK